MRHFRPSRPDSLARKYRLEQHILKETLDFARISDMRNRFSALSANLSLILIRPLSSAVVIALAAFASRCGRTLAKAVHLVSSLGS